MRAYGQWDVASPFAANLDGYIRNYGNFSKRCYLGQAEGRLTRARLPGKGVDSGTPDG